MKQCEVCGTTYPESSVLCWRDGNVLVAARAGAPPPEIPAPSPMAPAYGMPPRFDPPAPAYGMPALPPQPKPDDPPPSAVGQKPKFAAYQGPPPEEQAKPEPPPPELPQVAPAYGLPPKLPKATISSPNVRSYGLLAIIALAVIVIVIALIVLLR